LRKRIPGAAKSHLPVHCPLRTLEGLLGAGLVDRYGSETQLDSYYFIPSFEE
jgi:hypothetical protein